jgi:hypothetical protein
MMTMQGGRQAQVTAQPLVQLVVLQRRMALLLAEQHLDPGQQQEQAEQHQHPLEFGHQYRTQPYHQGTQHDHAQNAPEQHPVLIQRGTAMPLKISDITKMLSIDSDFSTR